MGAIVVVQTWSFLLLATLSVIEGSNECPKPCFCVKGKGGTKVSCSSRGITVLSVKTIPEDTVEIDLSANEIQVVNKDSFAIPRNNKVKKLVLRSNKIHFIQPGAFRRFPRLIKLYIEENSLLKIEDDTFKGLKRLKHLNISTNQLVYIQGTAFSHMSGLRKVSLSRNKLVTLTPEPFLNTSLKSIQLDSNPLICDCGLALLQKWTTENLVGISSNSKCFYPPQLQGTQLNSFLRNSLDCAKYPTEIPQFDLRPKTDQLAFEGDEIRFHCSTLWHPVAKLVWLKDDASIPSMANNSLVHDVSNLENRRNESILTFTSLRSSDSGHYKCIVVINGTRTLQKTVKLSVFSSKLKYCKMNIKRTDRGAYLWHNTAAGGYSAVPCQFGGYHPGSTARRNCSRSGHWSELGISRCLHQNKITRNLELLNSYAVNQTNVVQSTKILYGLSKNFTKNLTTVEEIQYIIDILNSAAKYGFYSPSLRRNILKVLNTLLGINVDLLRAAQFERQLSSRLLEVIPHTAQSTLDKKGNFNPIITSSIGTHVTSFQPRDYRGLSCMIRFPRGPRKDPIFEGGEVYCNAAKPSKLVEGLDAVVDFSPKLSSSSRIESEHGQRSWVNVTFIAYKDSGFFVETVPLSALTKKEDAAISSAIVGIHVQVPGTPRMGTIESVTIITFRNTKVGKNPRLVFWAKNDEKTGWVHMKGCVLSGTNQKFTQFKCSRIPARMLYVAIVMDVEHPPAHGVFTPEIFVVIGSGVCVAALLLSIMIYAAVRDLRYNRNDAAATMNLCLALLVSVLIFASGINQVQNAILCKALAVLLHYFLLCALLWLGCGGLCLQSLVVKVKANDEYNPVLKYYLIGWGLPMIICGITLAGNSKNYTTTDYCWLYPTASLAAFVGPGALFIVINLGIYIRLHTAINRKYPETGVDVAAPTMESKPKKSRKGSVPCTGDVEDFKFPKKAELLDILRGSLALMLWFCGNVTFAIMMLAYRNRPSSVLFNLFSYGYGIGSIFLGFSVLFFFCLRQEAVQLALKNVCWSSKGRNELERSNREDALLLDQGSCVANEIIVRPQEQLALMAGNVKDHSDVVSGISGPPSVFTDAMSSRPSSILAPTVPYNFEHNAEKVKELAPVSEREVTENEGRSLALHSIGSSKSAFPAVPNLIGGPIDSSGGMDARFRPRIDQPVGAPLATGDYSTGTLKKANGQYSAVVNTGSASVQVDQMMAVDERTLSEHRCLENSEQHGAHKRTGSVSGNVQAELPSNLKSFVPPNWKPARKGGSGVSYYPYFDHNFHRLSKQAPGSQSSGSQIPIGPSRAVPIPSRGDVQGGPATSVSLAVHSTIPLLSNRSEQCDSSSFGRVQPIGQAAPGNTLASQGPVKPCVISDDEICNRPSRNPSQGDDSVFLEPVLVHPSRHLMTQIDSQPTNPRSLNQYVEPNSFNINDEKLSVVNQAEVVNQNSNTNIPVTAESSVVEMPSSQAGVSLNYDKTFTAGTSSDPHEHQCNSVDTFSPTQSSQQSDSKTERKSAKATDSRRHRKRRRRKRPSSIAFDDIPVTKTIVYIPIPHVDQPIILREETSV